MADQAKVITPVSSEERTDIRVAAAQNGLSVGGLTYALVMHGLNLLADNDPDVLNVLAQQRERIAQARSKHGARGAAGRWGGTTDEEDEEQTPK